MSETKNFLLKLKLGTYEGRDVKLFDGLCKTYSELSLSEVCRIRTSISKDEPFETLDHKVLFDNFEGDTVFGLFLDNLRFLQLAETTLNNKNDQSLKNVNERAARTRLQNLASILSLNDASHYRDENADISQRRDGSFSSAMLRVLRTQNI